MGHGKKNANRGEAINRNAARIHELANKLKGLGNIVKDVKRELQDEINEILVVIDEMDEETQERLRLLERPWWKKLLRMDLEVKDAKEEEAVRETSDDAEPPASDSGPEDAGSEEKEGEAGQDESRVS